MKEGRREHRPRHLDLGLRGADEAGAGDAYGASKGVVSSLTLDGEARAHRIRVNAIAPGPFYTT